MKKYLVKSWKTHSTFTKSGMFYQTPKGFNSKIEANKLAKKLLDKDKVYAVEIQKYNEKLKYYSRVGKLLGNFPNSK